MHTFEQAWSELSPHLDHVLMLERDERDAWLDELGTRRPDVASRVRRFLAELNALDEHGFLERTAGPLKGAALGRLLSGATLRGQRFGAWTLEQPIGHGGMGTVWLASRSDGRFEGQAAVKLLNIAWVGHPLEQRFAREGSVLARLQHPHIAHLLDAGIATGSQPFLVLEYVRGTQIDKYCEQRGLDIEERIDLFLDVLAAVSHAHSNLIVHRDLKPSNILVTNHGVVKLLDFGVAALLSPEGSDTRLTRHVPQGLTLQYAAPEQVRGEAVTTATDVYALGAVLFVLLTGRHPFPAEGLSAAELTRRILERDAPLASSVLADRRQRRALRGDLDNILAMALQRAPARRYQTVGLLAQDLRNYLAMQPVSARPGSLGYRLGKFALRYRSAVSAAILVILVLAGAVAVTSAEMFEARRQRDEARYYARRAESSDEFLSLLLLSDGGPDRPALTVNERLELGVELLEKQYRDDPRFAGRMLADLAGYFRDNHETSRALELYRRAYDMGQSIADVELQLHAQCNRVFAESFADVDDGIAARIQRNRALLEQLGDKASAVLRADCLKGESRYEQRRGNDEKAFALLREAVQALEVGGSTHLQAYTGLLAEIGNTHLERNELAEVLRLSRLAGEIHERNGRGGTAARLVARQNAAVALSLMGEVRASGIERDLINEHVRRLETPGQEPLAYPVNQASQLIRMARPQEGLAVLDGVLVRAHQSGNRAALTATLIGRGWALVELKRWDEAEAVLEEGLAVVSKGIGARGPHAQLEVQLARLELARGNLSAAIAHRDRALELAGYRDGNPERSLARALMVAAEVSLAQANAPAAARFATDALSISESVARGPESSADVGEALLRLAQARLLVDPHDARARTMLERAERCLTNGLDATHPLARQARSLVALLSDSD